MSRADPDERPGPWPRREFHKKGRSMTVKTRVGSGARACRSTAAGLAALAGLASASWSKPPAALDLVPGDALLAVGVSSVEELVGRLRGLTRALGVEEDPIEGSPLEAVMSMRGLNMSGSMAMALMDRGEGEEPEGVAIVPVTDFAAVVAGAGGTVEGNVATLALDEETVYARDLGGGYAVVSPDRTLVAAFEGRPGQMEAHAKNLGPVGLRVASEAHAVVIANIPALAPQIEEGMGEFRDQMQMAMMLNPQAAAAGGQMAVVEALGDVVVQQARVALVGVSIDEKGGLTLDLALQFRDGSEAAAVCDAGGKPAGLLSRVPNVPFLLAFALDTSSPGVKQLMKSAEQVARQAAPEGEQAGGSLFDPFGGLGEQIDSTDGYAVVLGQTPALFGGLFSNSAAFLATRAPGEQMAAARASIEQMNGATIGGTKYATTFTAGAGEVDGVSYDEWGIQMTMDPNDPMGMQAQQMQSMLFGPSGMGGYIGQTSGGVVFTMARNTPLMKQAIAAARAGNGLGEQEAVRAVSSRLPASRAVEGYIGLKPILETVSQFMAMFGGGGGEMSLPASVPPVGLALAMDSGGAQLRLHAPGDAIKAVGQAIRSAQGVEEGGEKPAQPSGPRF